MTDLPSAATTAAADVDALAQEFARTYRALIGDDLTPEPDVAGIMLAWFARAAALPHLTPPPPDRWWIATGELNVTGSRKILGPFASRELALDVRSYVERVRGETYWVAEEPGGDRRAVAA